MDRKTSVAMAGLVLAGFLGGIVVFQHFALVSLGSRIENLGNDYCRLNATYFELLNIVETLGTDEVFVLAQNNVCCEVWKGFNDDGVGESWFIDGKFRMWTNDTSGGWALSKVCRGLMPHGWGLRYAPIEEIELSKENLFDVELDITLRLVDYKNYTTSNSSMNVALCFFFDNYIDDYQEKCHETEIQFFSYYGDRILRNQTWYFEWRNDSIAQVKLAENLPQKKIKHYEIDITSYFLDMIDHYELGKVKLKHIEIFTEAYNGYCELEVYDCKISTAKNVALP